MFSRTICSGSSLELSSSTTGISLKGKEWSKWGRVLGIFDAGINDLEKLMEEIDRRGGELVTNEDRDTELEDNTHLFLARQTAPRPPSTSIHIIVRDEGEQPGRRREEGRERVTSKLGS